MLAAAQGSRCSLAPVTAIMSHSNSLLPRLQSFPGFKRPSELTPDPTRLQSSLQALERVDDRPHNGETDADPIRQHDLVPKDYDA